MYMYINLLKRNVILLPKTHDITPAMQVTFTHKGGQIYIGVSHRC